MKAARILSSKLRQVCVDVRSLTAETISRARGCVYHVLFRACDSMGLHLSYTLPIAIGAGGCFFSHGLKPLWFSFPWVIKGWLASELCWIVWSKYTLRRLQQKTCPPPMSCAERELLWERCLKWAPDKRSFVSSWLYNISFHKISLDDCKSWIAWGLWGKRLNDLTPKVK